MIWLVSFASFSYIFASVLQAIALRRPFLKVKFWVLLLGMVAVIAHGALLHYWIDGASGQNLSLLNMFSLCSWLVAILVIIIASIRRVELLTLLVFPSAVVSIVLVVLFPNYYIVNTLMQPIMLFHIVISVFSLGILCVAGLLAIMLAFQERVLHYKKALWLFGKFPPLDSMERLLFQMITIGFILLSLVLASSFYFYYPLVFEKLFILQKTILVCLAWVIFALLLMGRFLWGWRGGKAIYGTLFAVLLLVVAYVGSNLTLETLL